MKDERKGISGLVFVSCMFIGGGVGLLFNRPEVGGAIGMGIGFLLMAFIKAREVEVKPVIFEPPRSFGRLVLILIGAILIASGICVLYDPKLLYPYVVGASVIALGILFLSAGLVKKGANLVH